MPGYIKMHRSVQDHWVYKDSDYYKAWSEMLFRARFIKTSKTDSYKGELYAIQYAQFIFGRPEWSKRLNIGEQKLRSLIKKLLDDNMIKLVQKLHRLTLYEIVNYEKFNQHDNQQVTLGTTGFEGNSNQHDNQQPTSRQPADNQQATTNEECKERKKGKKDIYITTQHLTMTKVEYDKLVSLYGQAAVDNKIEYARNYKKLKNFVSLYLTLNNWLKADKPQQSQQPKQQEKEEVPEWFLKANGYETGG